MTMLTKAALVVAVIAFLGVAGCAGSNYQPPERPAVDEAQAALVVALDAWKEGASVESLQQRQPPIYMSDHDWSAGRKLISFTVHSRPEIHGNNARLTVSLSLQGGKGRAKNATAIYLVNTEPVISVVRSDIAE